MTGTITPPENRLWKLDRRIAVADQHRGRCLDPHPCATSKRTLGPVDDLTGTFDADSITPYVATAGLYGDRRLIGCMHPVSSDGMHIDVDTL